MGVKRFLCVVCKQKLLFPWKLHVRLGKITLTLWAAGYALGLAAAHLEWGALRLTGSHFWLGTAMLPLLLIGHMTGLMLQKPAKRPPTLGIFHGACNTLAFLLSLAMIVTGVNAVRLFLLPS